MPEMPSGSKIRAALVFQAVQLGQHLRQALAEAGIEVVAESQADALASSGFDASLDVFVVNLDPELEDHLDEVSDLLDRYERPVIFNDGAASSGLAGWDQARWARHLAAKIRGELDSHPPRPKDSTYIPNHPKPIPKTPAPIKSVVNVPPSAVVSEAPKVVSAVASQVAKPLAATIELPKIVLAPVAIDALDEFDLPSYAETNSAESANLLDADFAWDELETLPPISPQTIIEQATSNNDVFELPDFDLPDFDVDADQKQAPDDFEALLKTQISDGALAAPIVATPEIASPAAAKAEPSFEAVKKDAPMDWSLEPLDSESGAEPMAPITGRAKYVARESSVAPQPVLVIPDGPLLPVNKFEPEALDELSDLDFFADIDDLAVSSHTPAPLQSTSAQKPQSLDELFADLDDMSFDAIAPMNSSLEDQAQVAASDNSFIDDFDFDLDVELPATTSTPSARDAGFDLPDFSQAIGSASEEFSAIAPSEAAGPARVYVLGASIGGPEAVKTFLSKLKPGIKAAFVLAQHMGAEFLELMAGQLAKSSALPVKLAQEGALLLESEVVVVPVNKRFMVDAAGRVEFHEIFDESPYSPSIDQVMSDMSDRFGDRCVGIIFSGMASDAIEGSGYIAGRGGRVWVQDPATCVISSMIDGAQAAGVVSFVGAPEQLADHVLEDLGVR